MIHFTVLTGWFLATTGRGQDTAPAAPQPATAEVIQQLVEDSQRLKFPRTLDPADALYVAEMCAVGLAADITAYNESMIAILTRLARRGDLPLAIHLSKSLPGHGTVEAQAALAVEAVQTGKMAEAHSCATFAASQSDRLSGQRAGKVRRMCALVLHRLSKAQEARPLEEKLDEVELLLLETSLHELGLRQALPLDLARLRVNSLKSNGISEKKALFLLACCQQHVQAGKNDLAMAFFSEIGKLATEDGLPHAQRVLLELARTAWKSGDKAEARKALNVFLKCCENCADGVEWKPSFLADASALMLDWNEREEAATWLKRAEAAASKVFILDAPKPILSIASVRERLQGAAAADELAGQALINAAKHPHPRSRAAAEVLVSLYYDGAGRPIPDNIRKLLSISQQEVER